MNEVVLITGVSSGFGKHTAELLVEKGYKVYGTSRRSIDIDSRISLLNLDITDEKSINKAIDLLLQKEGRIDILINNAGMGLSGAIEEFTFEEAKLQMDSNFFGMFRVIQAVLPTMRKQKGGVILNISSIGGLMGLPFQGFYSASKFAIEGFSDALRMELKQFNIKVVLINPGDFHTNFTANRKLISKSGPSSAYEQQLKKTLAIIEKDETNGLPPSFLAKKIYCIIKKTNPAARYVVASFEQKLAVVLKYILPDKLFYKIIGSHYGI
jgi:short-subunit dehydrogenase